MRPATVFGTLALALAALACGGEQETVSKGHPVTLARVVAVDVSEEIEAVGKLLAREHAEIAAEVEGRITRILVSEGSAVEAGTAVLTIDPERRTLELESARARVDEARARLAEERREYGRVKDLNARKVVSDTQVDAAATELKLAESQLQASQAELGVVERALRDASVAAPFDGIVGRRMVSRGEYVRPGDPLFELVALDPIEVEFNVPETDSGRVATGQAVELRLAPFPDETFLARVIFVSPTIDPRTHTLRVKAEVENPEGRLRPGLFARVDLGVSRREGVAMIPEEAVLQRSDGEVVFRAVADNRVERVRVETGLHQEGLVEVRSGLRVGDSIVTRGQAWLADGQQVVPRNPDGTLAAPARPEVAGSGVSAPANVP